jgi:hypothetical protein
MLYALDLEHLTQFFRFLDGCSANQDRSTNRLHLVDLGNDSVELATLRLEDKVSRVVTNHLAVGWNCDDWQVVNSIELFRFCFSCTSHPCELVVHAEIVLEGDSRHCHILATNPNVLLGLDRLVKSLAVAAANHHAAGEFIDDDDFTIANDVVLVSHVNSIGG